MSRIKGVSDLPRNPRSRKVEQMPKCMSFKPAGIPSYDLDEITLKIEELEAIRLKDVLHLDQAECALRMEISRPTFQRVLNSARSKIAEALLEGKALKIEGGDFNLGQKRKCCPRCEYSLVGTGEAECPKCGYAFEDGGSNQ